MEVGWTWNVSVDWRKHKKAIMQKPNVDAIIVNGEGTIHHSKDRKFAKALAEFAGFSNSTLKTPCYLINSTLFQNAEEEYNKLKEYRAIYVRDKGSLEELESFNLKGKYIPDLTFAYNAYKYSERKPTKGAVIVDSAIKEDNPILKRFAEAHHVPFKGMIVARRKNAKFIKSPRPYIKNIIMKVFKNIKSYDGSGTIGSWIKTIVVRKATKTIKYEVRYEGMEGVSEPVSDNYEMFTSHLLEKAIQSLPSGARAIFTLVEIEGYRHTETAKMLKISEGTSRSQLSYAKKLLRTYLKNEEK